MQLKQLLHLSPVVLVVCAVAVAALIGCDSLSGDDDNGSGGTSMIIGNISSFETASLIFEPLERRGDSLPARFAFVISELLLPSADARGQLEGIIVSIEGPVSRSTETSAEGTFSFSGLPAGTYHILFEFNGEQVRYRGRSGQMASITLGENQVAEMVNIRISGGRANIGNIRIMSQDNNDDNNNHNNDKD